MHSPKRALTGNFKVQKKWMSIYIFSFFLKFHLIYIQFYVRKCKFCSLVT